MKRYVFPEKVNAEFFRVARLNTLLAKIRDPLLAKKLQLDSDGVPFDSPLRVFEVSDEDFRESKELGFELLFGFRIVPHAQVSEVRP